MRRFSGLRSLLLAALACASCSKPAATTQDGEGRASAASTPEFAPAGVFYLIAPANINTPLGPRTLPTGTGVKVSRPGIYITPLGDYPINAALLTNDMTRARAARDAERASQARLQASANPAPSAPGWPFATPAPRFSPSAYQERSRSLEGNTDLGSTRSKIKDGWVWQWNAESHLWYAINRTDGQTPTRRPPPRPVLR